LMCVVPLMVSILTSTEYIRYEGVSKSFRTKS
jgi:hypothetical protein